MEMAFYLSNFMIEHFFPVCLSHLYLLLHTPVSCVDVEQLRYLPA